MKKITVIATLIIISAMAIFAQNNNDEAEILKIEKGLNEAYLNKNLAFFEQVWSPDFVFSTPSGKFMNRTESLKDLQTDWADPNFKVELPTSENIKVKILGNTAIVTGKWLTTANPANSEPHADSGRFTSIYEKRNGKWLMIAEHFSEASHDRKLMEQQVIKASQKFIQVLKGTDFQIFERHLADEYQLTNGEGKTHNKTEALANFKSGEEKIEALEIINRKVRIVGNNGAVETGTVKIKGSYKNQPYNLTEQYTTTWVWRDFRWQIVADHISTVK